MNWLQVGYQYTAGGIFFFVSLWVCLRLGAAKRDNASDRRALKYLVAGIAGYAVMHVVWILAATP